jgi:hypothetical protein
VAEGPVAAPDAPPANLRTFLLAALIWLPTAFVAWYWSAPAVQTGAWLTASALRALAMDSLVSGIEVDGRLFEVVTRIPAGGNGVLTFSVDPLIYSCGMPLFAGLTLASSGNAGAIIVRLLAGLLVLVPVQAFGVVMVILKTLAFDLAAAPGSALAWTPAAREAIALGYQLGSLVVPGVAGLMAWAALNGAFAAELAGGLGGAKPAKQA